MRSDGGMRSTLAATVRGLAVLCLGAALFTLGLAAGAAGAPAALACTCAQPNPDGDLATYAAQVDTVFSGTLNAVRLSPKLPDQPKATAANRPIRYVVAVENVYQGTLSATTVRVEPKEVRAACQLEQLPVGKRFVFFVDVVEGVPTVGGKCSGTQELTAVVLTQLDAVFAVPSTPEPEPLTATRTKVDDTVPIEFARLAAPGAALVILGALGLAIVGRLGRDTER